MSPWFVLRFLIIIQIVCCYLRRSCWESSWHRPLQWSSGITGCGHRPASVRYLSQTIFTHNSPSPFGLDQSRVDSSRSDDLSSNNSCVVVGEMSGCRLYFPRGGLVAETFYNTENMWNMKETREINVYEQEFLNHGPFINIDLAIVVRMYRK